MSDTNPPVGERPHKQSPAAMLASPSAGISTSPVMQPLFSHGKAGVGLFFQEEKKELIVRNIVPGGSAAADGRIHSGDIIISVDGKSVEGQGIETLRDCIIGSVGTFVELTFRRGSRASAEGSTTYAITLERKSQTKPVSSGQPDHSAAHAAPPLESSSRSAAPPSVDVAEASSLQLQQLHRRVSNLTFEKADLQSLLDQKNAMADSRNKTIEVLETQLQSSIAENKRLMRQVEASTLHVESLESKSAIVSAPATPAAAVSAANIELQQLDPRVMEDVSDMHGEWYAASCNYFEDGRVFVHFIGFPIACDIIVSAESASSRVRSHVAGTPKGPLHEDGSSFNTNSILAADCPSLLSAVNQSLAVEKELHDAAAMGTSALRQRFAAVVSETDDFNTASARFERLITHDIVGVMDTLASIAQDAAEIKSSRLESLQQIAATRKPFCDACANHVPPTEVILRDENESCSMQKCAAVERVAELKLMLQRAEQQLQKDIEAEELLTARFSSLQDISSKNSKLVFHEEAVNSALVEAEIDEHFSGLITRVKFHENECRALQLEIEAAQKTVQTQRESWQRSVCAKNDTEIDCRDVRLLFEHVHVAADPDSLAAHRVDGKVLTTLSVEVLCKKLGIKSFKEHLLVQHIKSCIANMSLESCVFKVPDDSPLSWSPQQVETWLVQHSLAFVVGAFKAEDLNGMAVLQLDDKLLDHFDVCASSLKHSQEVCTALQRLRASSVTRPKSLAGAGLGSIFLISPSDVISVAHVKPFQGSSGSVQQVKFQGMDAAKKQPHLTRALNDRDRGKFMKELEIAHKARHPFVVSMLGACVDDDNMFLLMEWMDGGSLFDALGNQVKRPLLARKRVSIAREIAGGLVYLHSSGIIHRDIKSLNVLLTGDNHAKLCDFGLATLHTLTTTATSSREGRPGGTLPWMAPELVLSGSKCSESTDVYSFGVIMWELLTCEVPFEGCNSVQIEAQLRNGFRPDLPDPIPKGFLPEYVALMQQCWHQDASQRPSSQDVHTALLAMDYTAQVNGPIELYPKDYCISPSVTLQSILQTAMPEPSHQLLLARIVAAVRDVFSQAPSFVEQSRTHGLSALEAQCVCAYTLDAQQFQATRESSPFFLYNAALRSRDAAAVGRWRDFSCVFEAALKKLPDNACRVFRGLDCSLTEVSHLYETGGRVWLNSVTSCTTDKQVTMATFGSGAGGSPGTFIELIVHNAKDIRAFSPYPENELLIPLNSCFSVKYSLSSADAALLGVFGSLPPNVDLVILEQERRVVGPSVSGDSESR